LAPNDKYIFIMDQLNTHKSESLVKYIAKICNIKEELGKKGSHGILKSMPTRQEFLKVSILCYFKLYSKCSYIYYP